MGIGIKWRKYRSKCSRYQRKKYNYRSNSFKNSTSKHPKPNNSQNVSSLTKKTKRMKQILLTLTNIRIYILVLIHNTFYYCKNSKNRFLKLVSKSQLLIQQVFEISIGMWRIWVGGVLLMCHPIPQWIASRVLSFRGLLVKNWYWRLPDIY